MPGERISVSMTPTRNPELASSAARLAVVVDLPVPSLNEWTDTIFDNEGPFHDCRAYLIRGPANEYGCKQRRPATSMSALRAPGEVHTDPISFASYLHSRGTTRLSRHGSMECATVALARPVTHRGDS